MVKVLHVVPALGAGGIEAMLYNYYGCMDKEKVKFDFAIHSSEDGLLGEKFKNNGSKIYHITPKKDNLIKCIRDFDRLFKQNLDYDIVHVHQNNMSFIPLFFAKKYRVKVRIFHSHTCIKWESKIKEYYHRCLRLLNIHFATELYACGIEAGKWLYGSKYIEKNKVTIINNVIDIDKFIFDEDIRKKLRKDYKVENDIVIGFAGRFSIEKNLEFLIDVFNEMNKISKDVKLVLIGDGSLKQVLQEQVKLHQLEDRVIFTGLRDDVNSLLNMMDVLLLPSLYEGFPVTLIEAQACGLKCVVSSNISGEVDITNNETVNFLNINDTPEEWAKYILNLDLMRKDNTSIMIENGYSIKKEALKLLSKYIELVN